MGTSKIGSSASFTWPSFTNNVSHLQRQLHIYFSYQTRHRHLEGLDFLEKNQPTSISSLTNKASLTTCSKKFSFKVECFQPRPSINIKVEHFQLRQTSVGLNFSKIDVLILLETFQVWKIYWRNYLHENVQVEREWKNKLIQDWLAIMPNINVAPHVF